MGEDTHHSSLLRGYVTVVDDVELVEVFDPYWNIEVCVQCGGGGSVPSGVEHYGQHEMVGCDACYGIGYTNERIQEILDEYFGMQNELSAIAQDNSGNR